MFSPRQSQAYLHSPTQINKAFLMHLALSKFITRFLKEIREEELYLRTVHHR